MAYGNMRKPDEMWKQILDVFLDYPNLTDPDTGEELPAKNYGRDFALATSNSLPNQVALRSLLRVNKQLYRVAHLRLYNFVTLRIRLDCENSRLPQSARRRQICATLSRQHVQTIYFASTTAWRSVDAQGKSSSVAFFVLKLIDDLSLKN